MLIWTSQLSSFKNNLPVAYHCTVSQVAPDMTNMISTIYLNLRSLNFYKIYLSTLQITIVGVSLFKMVVSNFKPISPSVSDQYLTYILTTD